MRYFKVCSPEGSILAFGRNDTVGMEISETEYSELCAQYAPVSDEPTAADYVAALGRLGVA